MNYLLVEILACLLIAGLIGAIIGWLLRGGCSKKIKDCEEECRMKLNSLESNYDSIDDIDDYQKKFENEATKVNQSYQEINEEIPSLRSDDLKLDTNDIKLENHFLSSDSLSTSNEEIVELKGFNKAKNKIKIPTLGGIAIDDINLEKPILTKNNKLDIELETPEISRLSMNDIELNQKKEEDISLEFTNPDIELKSQRGTEENEKFNIPNIPDKEEKKDIKLNIPDLSLDTEKKKPAKGFILGDNIDEKTSLLKKESIINKEDMQGSYDIQEIEGIGPAYGRKLRSMGVDSTLDLIELFKKNNHRIDRAAQDMRVKPEAITAWISMADLMRLPGVNSQCAELLQTVGISSAIELSITNAHSIHSEMLKFNKKYPVCPEVPSAETITSWILSAKNS